MATINVDKNFGYERIAEKMEALINDVNTMVEKEEISKEAAVWLLNEFKSITGLCAEATAENDQENKQTYSF